MKPSSILVIDDSPTMRRVLIESLKKIGFTSILQASSGETALDILSKQSVDLVVLDIEMPGMNGLAVLWMMKRDWSAPVFRTRCYERLGYVVGV